MLAEVGRPTSEPASPAADVLPPKHEEFALRVHPAAGPPIPAEPEEPPGGPDDGPKPPDLDRPAVVLIWVVGPPLK
jgi:hypothetical protein